MEKLKKVAILGRPNVGKSSLFNRLIRKRDAITSDVSGTTRDVKKRIATISQNREFELIDTGGIDDTTMLFAMVKAKSLQMADEADVILYMVSGKELPDEEDKRLFYQLQRLNKPIALLVNKIDNDKEESENFWNFYEFGAEFTFGMSVGHNRKLNPFYNWLEKFIPVKKELLGADENGDDELFDDDMDFEDTDEDNYYLEEFVEDDELEAGIEKIKEEIVDNNIKVAIIGRVNTGKSSLLNALLGDDRAIVSDIAGTTIDPIDETVEYAGHNITFVDTAGIRRKSKIIGLEKYALDRTEQMLKTADVALLVIDATAGVVELDERIANLIEKYKLASLIVVNKWDIRGEKSYEKMVEDIRNKLRFLHYAPLITVSAKSGQRVHKILDEIIGLYGRYKQRITTSKLNEILKFAISKHHVPSVNGSVIRIKFATQYESKPPKIALIVNRPEGVHFSYKRYLANVFREHFDLGGVPLDIVVRKRGQRDDDKQDNAYGEY
ncbi:MAG: ribosome biogenesis GTPase Der [Epsilonproteobacteria bacterium]|nr:ribosome biogenesis GTPase Der [Campylobacterota bacterium]MBD3839436.1 ribosome biogenesis GTPase Der [Campylobacterota bacterium]